MDPDFTDDGIVQRSGNGHTVGASDWEATLVLARRRLAEVSERLSVAETEAYLLRADACRLPGALARSDALEKELAALRYRFDDTEARLQSLRKSLSWKITHPVRWVGRTYKKMLRRGAA